MYTLVIVLSVLISILLIIVVLVQKSKGGGLSSAFAGSNQIMGVRRTNDFIEKATWTLAGIIGLLAIISVFVMPRNMVQSGSRVKPVNEIQTVTGTEYTTPAPAVSAETTEQAPSDATGIPAESSATDTPAAEYDATGIPAETSSATDTPAAE